MGFLLYIHNQTLNMKTQQFWYIVNITVLIAVMVCIFVVFYIYGYFDFELNNDRGHLGLKSLPINTVIFPKTLSEDTRRSVSAFVHNLTDADKYARSHFRSSQSVRDYVDSYILTKPSLLMRQTVQSDIIAIHEQLHKKGFANVFVKMPWKICFLGDQVENNLPHTHNDTIFLPLNFHTLELKYRRTTLLHEQIHVFQRFHPIPTQTLFADHWALRIVGIRQHNTPKDSTLRSNPDLNRLIYTHYDPVLESFVRMEQLYTSTTPQRIIDAQLTKLRHAESDSSNHTSRDTTYFDLIQDHNIRQAEHPNEVMAYLIPKIVFQDASHGVTQTWMRKHF